jgi:hypothetical protein
MSASCVFGKQQHDVRRLEMNFLSFPVALLGNGKHHETYPLTEPARRL